MVEPNEGRHGPVEDEYERLSWAAAGWLNTWMYIKDDPHALDAATLRDLREGFRQGKVECDTATNRATPPEFDVDLDYIDPAELGDRCYVLRDGVTPQDFGDALAKLAPELAVELYSPDTVTDLHDLVMGLVFVCNEFTQRIRTETRRLYYTEWRALGDFYLKGLLLVAAATPADPPLTTDSTGDLDKPGQRTQP